MVQEVALRRLGREDEDVRDAHDRVRRVRRDRLQVRRHRRQHHASAPRDPAFPRRGGRGHGEPPGGRAVPDVFRGGEASVDGGDAGGCVCGGGDCGGGGEARGG